MIFDIPPKIWVPPRPAIIRPYAQKQASFLPGMFPAGAVGGGPASISHVASVADASSQTNYSYPSVNFGIENSTRAIIVGSSYRRSGNNAAVNVSAMTIGGVTASHAISLTNNQAADGLNGVSLWIARVPSGPTGDISVALSGAGADRMGIVVWSALDLLSIIQTATATGQNPSSFSMNTNTNSGGVAVGVVMANSDPGIAWTGLTENTQFITEGDLAMSGASLATSAASTPLSITITISGGDAIGLGCVAAFR